MKKFIYLSILEFSICLVSCTNTTTPNDSSPIDSSVVKEDMVVTEDELKAAAAKLPSRKEAGVLTANLTGPMTISSNAGASLSLGTSDTSKDSTTSYVSQFNMTFNYNEVSEEFVLDEDNSSYDPLLKTTGIDSSIYAEMFEEALTDNIASMIDELDKVDEVVLKQAKFTLLKDGGFKVEVEQEQDCDISKLLHSDYIREDSH